MSGNPSGLNGNEPARILEGRNAQRARIRSIISQAGSSDGEPSPVEVPPVRFADEVH